MLFRAEEERDNLNKYVPMFHEADKQVAILGEKLKSNKVNEILFVVLVGLGCAIIGLAPFFWANLAQGIIVLAIGVVAIVAGTLCRVFFQCK